VTIVIDEGFYHTDLVAVITYISTKYMFFFYPGDINPHGSATATQIIVTTLRIPLMMEKSWPHE